MFDLSNFRDRCSYCFRGIGCGLSVCSCGMALCSTHRALHTAKFGCHVVFEVREDSAGAVAVEPVRDCADGPGELARRIAALLAAGDAPECPHVAGPCAAPVGSTACCADCDLTENLWACTGCGHVGCGRGQAERRGNGHALAHFEAAGAPLHAAAASLSDAGQVHCYVCDSYVRCPNLVSTAGNIRKEEKAEGGSSAAGSMRLAGIKNAGQTCYVASVLQLLSSAFARASEDPAVHFSLCCTDPLRCLCCQFVRILGALSQDRPAEDTQPRNITDFLALLEREMPEYAVGTQQDCTEFLQDLLARIAAYEEAMLLPPLTPTVGIPITTFISCEGCGRCSNTRTREAVLYVNYAAALSEAVASYFAPASVPCSCGAEATIRPTIDGAARLPSTFIVAVKRYGLSDGTLSKITSPISVDRLEITDYLEPAAQKTVGLRGCVVHTGSSLHCGHYTWWTRHDGRCAVVDDEQVRESDEMQPQDGVVFLFE